VSIDLLIALRLLVAAVLGAAIGFQRERLGKPAGLRTHMLICIGAALFTLVSMYGFGPGSDPARVASNIVTGIGFIGAGAIIFRSTEGYVVGLTTASTIWISAGVGMAVGAGLYIAAATTTVIALIVLFIPLLK
jgi:putative Mg2+ transporter-C (MgtC) family protein